MFRHLPTILFCFGLIAVVSIQEARPLSNFRDKITFKFNEGKPSMEADTLRLISFGYSRFLSNLLWLRFLQFTPVEKVPPGETSWIYYDLDALTTLDPKFTPAYEQGGIFLSVITEDKAGAEKLLKKGKHELPHRWRIPAYLAYHYQYELNRVADADKEYADAANVPGAPEFLSVFAARHIARTQSIEATIAFLQGLRDGSTDERMRKNFQYKIEKWKEKLREAKKK